MFFSQNDVFWSTNSNVTNALLKFWAFVCFFLWHWSNQNARSQKLSDESLRVCLFIWFLMTCADSHHIWSSLADHGHQCKINRQKCVLCTWSILTTSKDQSTRKSNCARHRIALNSPEAQIVHNTHSQGSWTQFLSFMGTPTLTTPTLFRGGCRHHHHLMTCDWHMSDLTTEQSHWQSNVQTEDCCSVSRCLACQANSWKCTTLVDKINQKQQPSKQFDPKCCKDGQVPKLWKIRNKWFIQFIVVFTNGIPSWNSTNITTSAICN